MLKPDLKIEFTDLIDVETLQRFQDSFSDATGVASIITYPDGVPITKPSNFCSLCLLIRRTKKGLENCYRSDAIIGRKYQGGPIFHKCLSGGLWDGGASITVDGKHIANWLIGQVIIDDSDTQRIINYAKEIDADEKELKNALKKVTRMPLEQFKKIANSLYIFANELSEKAYQNLQLKLHQEHLEYIVKERTEELMTANEELLASNEELYLKGKIIESKNAELEKTLKNLHEAQMQLYQAEKMASLGTLTAGVAHEINNPLNFIMGAYVGFENYFNEYGSENEQITNKLLGALELGIERTSNIVKGLNQFSRDSGNYTEDCDIPVIIDNCLVILQNKIKNKIEICKNFQSDTILIKGNIGKFHQVFLNLLTNAIEAIPETGEIAIEVNANNKNVSITITDNGEGIDKKFISQITDPFFTTKPPGKGTGLGLSITYTIINEHNGKISFESEKNKGTKVIITLPINHNGDAK